MSIITLVIVLVILGLALWLLETYVPMAQPIRIVIRVVVVLAIVIWILQLFGIWSGPKLTL